MAARSVWCRSRLVRRPPVRSRNCLSRRVRISPGPSPSSAPRPARSPAGSRRDDDTGRARPARSRRPASARPAPRPRGPRTTRPPPMPAPTLRRLQPAVSSDANGEMCSPRTPSASRLVASTDTRAACAVVVAHERRHRADEMLAVVEHQQQVLALQEPRQPLRHRHTLRRRVANRGRDRIGQVVRIQHLRQLAQPHPVGIVRQELGADLEREARLAHPTDAHDRHHPRRSHPIRDRS